MRDETAVKQGSERLVSEETFSDFVFTYSTEKYCYYSPLAEVGVSTQTEINFFSDVYVPAPYISSPQRSKTYQRNQRSNDHSHNHITRIMHSNIQSR